ncbi:unannotated protein [freshwater metagenome]|uniref:Unannotated protein n=1 Tax=freshwater metagenome TaxID=449393 RepID=A0A6J6F5E2_9ZZZZ
MRDVRPAQMPANTAASRFAAVARTRSPARVRERNSASAATTIGATTSVAVSSSPRRRMPTSNTGMPGGDGNAKPPPELVLIASASALSNWATPRVATTLITFGARPSRPTTMPSTPVPSIAAIASANGSTA